MALDIKPTVKPEELTKDEYKYGFHDSDANYSFKSGKGLTRETVEQISEMKSEPGWMRDIRLKALEVFVELMADDNRLAEIGNPPLRVESFGK